MNSIVPALLWAWLMASSFIVSGYVTAYGSPLAATGLRFLLALIMMTPIYWYTRKEHSGSLVMLLLSPKILLQQLLISGALVSFFIGLFAALKTTTSLNTSVLYSLLPLIAALLAGCFGIKTRRSQWLGYVLGASGAITVLLFSREGLFIWHVGDTIYLVACCLLAFHVVAVQLWNTNVSPFEGAYRITFFGTLWLLPLVFLWGEPQNLQWHIATFWYGIIYLATFTTLLTFVLQQIVVRNGGASRLLAFSYTIPIWVACVAYFSQASLGLLSKGFIIGTVMVIIALVMIDGQFKWFKQKRHG
ncbi:DMT family transporter [Celerinatantimonas sp. YJH-8]|uniref:DMT family transporter n=1 Tax=Celerinatantimonas sp. YJH-8 TaxID=3228714 RepID=UPI0038C91502